MAKFSTDELKAIRTYPLKPGLDAFRAIFASKCLKAKGANVAGVVEQSEASDRGTGTIHGLEGF